MWKHSKSYMQRAGFVDVTERRFKWPIGDWPTDRKLKHLGRMNTLRLIQGIEGYMLRLLTRSGNVSPLTNAGCVEDVS